MQLVCVVLDCQPWFEDSMALLDFGLRIINLIPSFQRGQVLGKIPVIDGFKSYVNVVSRDGCPAHDGREAEKIEVKTHLPYDRAPVKPAKRPVAEISWEMM